MALMILIMVLMVVESVIGLGSKGHRLEIALSL